MLKDGQIVAYGEPQEVLNNPILNELYGINIKEFMLDILEDNGLVNHYLKEKQ